ncbi:acyl carrier protein [bacterium]|nr:acyl carrier protein [bacterium]
MSRTRDALKNIAKKRLEIDLTDEMIDSGTSFKDLGIDSLDAIELIVSVEDLSDLELSDARLDDIENIKQLADYLAEFD